MVIGAAKVKKFGYIVIWVCVCFLLCLCVMHVLILTMLEEKQKKSRQISSFDLNIYPFLNEIVYLHAHDAGFNS